MSALSKIDELTIPPDHESPLQLLQDHLQDLLLIHMELPSETVIPIPEFPSIYLKESRYVSGGKSEKKSYMLFECRIGKEPENNDGDKIYTVKLSVKPKEL